jgi:hypothetical protein
VILGIKAYVIHMSGSFDHLDLLFIGQRLSLGRQMLARYFGLNLKIIVGPAVYGPGTYLGSAASS